MKYLPSSLVVMWFLCCLLFCQEFLISLVKGWMEWTRSTMGTRGAQPKQPIVKSTLIWFSGDVLIWVTYNVPMKLVTIFAEMLAFVILVSGSDLRVYHFMWVMLPEKYIYIYMLECEVCHSILVCIAMSILACVCPFHRECHVLAFTWVCMITMYQMLHILNLWMLITGVLQMKCKHQCQFFLPLV